ncbi:3-beta hydroxysteroid dehydrogenase/isomerase family protein [Ralstonia insidiosa]|uniref:3-beta hydroxysteroid dehydrogenase/isomerase family protein n=1 Tax=Ralstonia insidiosa TaxID=190721 RepID=A0AAC9FS33_9RALS|nr:MULTISPECIES: NAD-dependent epimerase/dehydratase family protein [Ralstonia]ANH74102.1 3-beta hydroxysteroid dehydrogenase/isomerase family protein [Ralstonia insidiosa]EPX97038.1 GDP-6-deoxy-D-lyxo-4-hexulose reductase [Ralstonia sp. AU12-08]MBY4704892.1 GDP-mannose 4,6-dehydratase [Ralstonia insidiosa]GAQ30115.1 NAD-dependent epimerase/dehydratase [Ralstonia sp. NT80]
MAKVLITGVQGFTGRHLLEELLRAGHEVCGLEPMPAPEAKVPVHACDLLDHVALAKVLAREQPDMVVHLAAIAFVAHGDARAIYDTNVVGTRNLLDAIHTSGCRPRSVLLTSSANVYGNADREILDESTPAAPANDYAVSKLAMEYMAKLWEDKLPITIARPFNYTGVGQSPKFLLPKIVSHFRERKPVLELGNLHVVRDFSDVRSVVAAYARLLDGRFAGQTFNVCSGTGYALKEVLAMLSDLTGYQPEIKVNMAFVRANEVHTLIGSSAKLRKAVGALPTIALRDTLQWMLEAEE